MTIKDVANYCGVSVSTVSRALNNHPDVNKSTRDKVMRAVQQLHYVPNDAARDLVAHKSDTIGVVVRGAENPFFTAIIRSMERACEQAGYTMVLHQIPAGADEVAEGAKLVQSKRLRGLILLGGRFDYGQEQGESFGVPFVCCSYTNQFGSFDDNSHSSVSIDDYREGYKATHYLIEQGHRNIAVLLDSTHDHSISELRYQGYCQALADAGIAIDPELVLECVDFSMEAAYRRVEKLLAERKDLTAIFAVADSMAIAAMKALSDAGMRVPEDCSVMAIDGIDMSLYTVPTLTTLCQPQKTLGEEAVKILVGVVEGKNPNRHLRLETALRQGGTVAHIG